MASISDADPTLRNRLADKLYTGELQYGRSTRYTRVYRHGGNSCDNYYYRMMRNKSHNDRACWVCGKKGYIPFQCFELIVRNFVRKFSYYQRSSFKGPTKATKLVLFELCQDLDHDHQSVYETIIPAQDLLGDFNSDDGIEDSQNGRMDVDDSTYFPEQLFS